jgi:hypothetical protein
MGWEHPGTLFCLAYRILRHLLDLLIVITRSDVSKDVELLVLRHENAVLRRQIRRPRYEHGDRLWFAALSRLVPRRSWAMVFPVTPATVLRWRRHLTERCGRPAACRRAAGSTPRSGRRWDRPRPRLWDSKNLGRGRDLRRRHTITADSSARSAVELASFCTKPTPWRRADGLPRGSDGDGRPEHRLCRWTDE